MEADKFIAVEMSWNTWRVFSFENGISFLNAMGKSFTVSNDLEPNLTHAEQSLRIRFLDKDDLDNALVKKMLGIKEE